MQIQVLYYVLVNLCGLNVLVEPCLYVLWFGFKFFCMHIFSFVPGIPRNVYLMIYWFKCTTPSIYIYLLILQFKTKAVIIYDAAVHSKHRRPTCMTAASCFSSSAILVVPDYLVVLVKLFSIPSLSLIQHFRPVCL